MKEILKDGFSRVLAFEVGEEVLNGMVKYCEENNIKAGWLHMLGGCGELELYFYDKPTKKYEPKEINYNLEVLACTGNITTLDGKIVPHVHGSFSGRDFGVFGGHVNKMVVSLTIEVHLRIFNGEIKREFDEPTGLNLMCPL